MLVVVKRFLWLRRQFNGEVGPAVGFNLAPRGKLCPLGVELS
jgi:hypothetical protein